MPIILRPYVPDDFETLYQIDQACYPPGIAYSKRALRWFLRLPSAGCLVAETEGRLTGFILAEHVGTVGHLITIDVLEAHRRRGVGTALLSRVEREFTARGVREIELETATDNHAAVAFWHRHGYRTVRVLRGYYPGHLDAFFMRKPLSTAKET